MRRCPVRQIGWPAGGAGLGGRRQGARLAGGPARGGALLRRTDAPGHAARLAIFLAALAILAYGARAILQLATLGGQDLTYDFGQFWDGARALGAGADPYQRFLTQCSDHFCPTGYTYPPLLGELLRPLTGLPEAVAAGLWLVLMQACVVATLLLVGRLIRRWISTAALALLLAATLLFFPLYQALYFLQVLPLLTLLLAIAGIAYIKGRDAAAGSTLALGTALRVSPVLVAPALLVSQAQLKRPLGAVVLVAVLTALAGTMWLLTPVTAEYVTTVLPRIAAGSGELDNQAPIGLLLRLHSLAPALPLNPRSISLVLSAAVLAATCWLCREPAGERARALVFAAFLAATPLIGSVTEPYHYTTELLVLALAAASLPARSLPWWLAVVSYPLLWMDGHVTNAVALSLGLQGPTGWRVAPFLVVTSTNLVGAVLLWLACLAALRRQRLGRGEA